MEEQNQKEADQIDIFRITKEPHFFKFLFSNSISIPFSSAISQIDKIGKNRTNMVINNSAPDSEPIVISHSCHVAE